MNSIYSDFLKVKKVPITQMCFQEDVEDVHDEMRELILKDRDKMEKVNLSIYIPCYLSFNSPPILSLSLLMGNESISIFEKNREPLHLYLSFEHTKNINVLTFSGCQSWTWVN